MLHQDLELDQYNYSFGWENPGFSGTKSKDYCFGKVSLSVLKYSPDEEFRIHLNLASKKSLHMIATYIVNLRNTFPAFFVPSKGCRINIQDELSLYLSYQILTGCTAWTVS